MKLTLTKAPIIKDYVSKKTNKPYKKAFLKTQEHGADLLSGFYRQEMSAWKEGDTIEVESVGQPTVSADGKTTYRDFQMAKKEGQNELLEKTYKNTEQILNVLAGLKIDLLTRKPAPQEDLEDEYPETEVETD